MYVCSDRVMRLPIIEIERIGTRNYDKRTVIGKGIIEVLQRYF